MLIVFEVNKPDLCSIWIVCLWTSSAPLIRNKWVSPGSSHTDQGCRLLDTIPSAHTHTPTQQRNNPSLCICSQMAVSKHGVISPDTSGHVQTWPSPNRKDWLKDLFCNWCAHIAMFKQNVEEYLWTVSFWCYGSKESCVQLSKCNTKSKAHWQWTKVKILIFVAFGSTLIGCQH